TAGPTLTFNLCAQRVTDKIPGMVVRGPKIYLMDGLLVLYGPNRQVIAQNDNAYGGDSFLAVTLPSDGEYTLEVRDARYAGSGRYPYCVEISDRPHVHATLPMGMQPGSATPLKLIGPNLGDSPIVEFTAPDSAMSGWQQQTLNTPAGATNPVHLLVSAHPQGVASGENVSRETAQPIEVPSGISGQLAEPDQAHWYSFAAS